MTTKREKVNWLQIYDEKKSKRVNTRQWQKTKIPTSLAVINNKNNLMVFLLSNFLRVFVCFLALSLLLLFVFATSNKITFFAPSAWLLLKITNFTKSRTGNYHRNIFALIMSWPEKSEKRTFQIVVVFVAENSIAAGWVCLITRLLIAIMKFLKWKVS